MKQRKKPENLESFNPVLAQSPSTAFYNRFSMSLPFDDANLWVPHYWKFPEKWNLLPARWSWLCSGSCSNSGTFL